MRYWKESLLFGACAAACAAPLVFGSVAVGLGAAGLGFLDWDEIGMVAALVAVGAGFFLWQRSRPAPLVSANAGCGCAPTAGCNTENACNVPESTTETTTGLSLAKAARMLNRRQLFAFVAATTVALSAPALALEEGKFERTKFEAAQSAGKPILLHVSAEWCETCHAQKKVIEELEADPKFRVYSIYTIDFDSEKDVMRSFDATSRSTLIVFKGTTEMGRLVGDTKEESIKALMEKGL